MSGRAYGAPATDPAGLSDARVVACQLSRRSVRPFQVALRCPAGYPSVIETAPIAEADETPAPLRGRPGIFTTLYWLTCPKLVRQVSGFESRGWIKRMESAVGSDDAMRDSMNRLHKSYALRRRRAVGQTRLKRLRLSSPRLAKPLETSGIGGVSDITRLKCLHAHAAFHLVRGGGHPVFEAHPEILPDLAGCRACDSFSAGRAPV